jgi:hypothetical protein
VAETTQGLKGRVLKKKFVLPIESWFFTFFTFFLFMVLHDVTFNATATIKMCMMSPSMRLLQSKCEVFYFFKKYYKVHSVEVLSQDPINKKNSSSLIIINVELRFKPYMLHLIWK